MTRVLIADDDARLRSLVGRHLARDGYEVSLARNGMEAKRLLGSQRIDIAVLDAMMPGPNGMSLCRKLRQRCDHGVPIILVSSLVDEDDRIAGLEAGADDYMTKPFSPHHLLLRIRSVLRRATGPALSIPSDLTVGELTVSSATRSVTVTGRVVTLTNREFNLLLFFLHNTGAVFSRQELLERVWHWNVGDLSTVTVHVKRLRSKLGDQHQIVTVWGRGYLWAASD
ncbi:MAG: response regulator transcription factor [Mycobacterium sp.]